MVDRALNQLLLSGALDGVVGVALGTFDGFDGYQDRGWTLLDVLSEHLDALGVPVRGGLPLGHGQESRTVTLGLPCTLDADAGLLTGRP